MRGRRAVPVIFASAMMLVCCALASAAQPKPDGVYKGSEAGCKAPTGLSCVFSFRVSASGKTMRFDGTENVVGAWRCKGGGGEAILGPYKKPMQGQPIPLLTISSNGTFQGTQAFGPASGHGMVVASGHFTGTGTTATIKFTLDPGPHVCVNGPASLSSD